MVYPFVSLEKRRTDPIIFSEKGVHLEVHGAVEFGLATIWDWDVVIALCSHLNEGIEAGRPISEVVQFSPASVLHAIGRPMSGREYRRLADSIRRLRTTTVIVNEHLAEASGIERSFSWVSDYELPVRYSRSPGHEFREPACQAMWTVELPSALVRIVAAQERILALHPDYFLLRSGIARALYRLARKSAPEDGRPYPWRMETLHRRFAIKREFRKFASDIRRLSRSVSLPEYRFSVSKVRHHEVVVFHRDRSKPPRPRRGIYHSRESAVLQSLRGAMETKT